MASGLIYRLQAEYIYWCTMERTHKKTLKLILKLFLILILKPVTVYMRIWNIGSISNRCDC